MVVDGSIGNSTVAMLHLKTATVELENIAFRYGTGVLAGALLVLGPAHFQQESLLHVGIHFESLLWMAIIFDLGLRVAGTPAGSPPDRRVLIGLGLASGFGTYFSYQVPFAVLATITCVVQGLFLI